MLKTSVGRLRFIALAEAISYLVLLGVAMPLKYLAHLPEPVKYTGWVHGVLFVLFCAALLHATLRTRWSLMFAGLIFVASLIPFAPFFLDRHLREVEETESAGSE